MSVVDASVLVDALIVVGPAGERARSALGAVDELHVPAIFPAEVTSAIRKQCLRGDLSESRARGALARAQRIRVVEYPFAPLVERIWELHASVTVYDAWYIALAERLGTELVTADARLASSPGGTCSVRVVA